MEARRLISSAVGGGIRGVGGGVGGSHLSAAGAVAADLHDAGQLLSMSLTCDLHIVLIRIQFRPPK